jgi:hypothetical protein
MHCACQLYHASKHHPFWELNTYHGGRLPNRRYVIQEYAAAAWNKILSPIGFKKVSRLVRLRLLTPLFGTWDEQAVVAVSAVLSLLGIYHMPCSMGVTLFAIMRRVYWRCSVTAELVRWQSTYPLIPSRTVGILLCAVSCRTALGCHMQWVLMVLFPKISSWSVELITHFLSVLSSRICGALPPCPHMLMCYDIEEYGSLLLFTQALCHMLVTVGKGACFSVNVMLIITRWYHYHLFLSLLTVLHFLLDSWVSLICTSWFIDLIVNLSSWVHMYMWAEHLGNAVLYVNSSSFYHLFGE